MKLNIYQNIPVLPFLIESFHDLFSFGRILLASVLSRILQSEWSKTLMIYSKNPRVRT